jgi:hypothetical protein
MLGSRPVRIPPLLPSPRKLAPGRERFRLRGDLPIVLAEGSDDLDFASAVALRSAIAEKSGITLPIETHARTSDLGARLELSRKGAAGAMGAMGAMGESGEGYRLLVTSESVRAEGEGPAGLRYAVETLSQLLLPGERSLPALAIEDAPDLEKRGVLIDVSRGKVPTLETMKRLVDLLVGLKLNLLMLYTEHVFRFRRHPWIGKGASPMTASEIRELDAYASERHVELVPTLQSLGHMHQILKHSRYAHLAESEKKWSLSPALEETYRLLGDLYSEYLGNFRSRWFNANCDEPVDLGKGVSKSRAEKEGVGALFASHLERVRDLAARHGKRTMAWADVIFEHPEAVALLPRDVVFIDWWYEAKHDFDRLRVFAENGIPFMAACGTSSWNSLFPRLENALANIRGYATAAKRHGARGLIVTDWGDNGHYNLLGNSIYAFAFAAQAAWGSATVAPDAFDRTFSLQLFSDRSGGVGRLYRRLGSLHETGFEHFNHSPLKSLYFDDLTRARFTAKARRGALNRTLRELVRVRERFERESMRLARRPGAREELRFAIDASIAAARKGLAGLDYLERRGARAALAKRLRRLASSQADLKRRHLGLWLERNRESNFEIVASYYDASIQGLRSAARILDRYSSFGSSGGRGRGRGR